MGQSGLYQGAWKRRLSANETNKARPDMARWHGYPRYEGLDVLCIRQKERNGQSFMEGDCND